VILISNAVFEGCCLATAIIIRKIGAKQSGEMRLGIMLMTRLRRVW
jgi:hypothetical protein